MHKTVQNLINIENKIKSNLSNINKINLPNIIAVSKTFKIDKILPLIDYGHLNFGENKVQEAVDKWTILKKERPNIQLHMIGRLQTNKVKFAVKLFDFIHSVDSAKLAKKIASEQIKINKRVKIFIQVNIGDENQKSGINKNELNDLVSYSKMLDLNIIGLMCIPPVDVNPTNLFKEMSELNNSYNFQDLSMGMSSDYIDASRNNATYLRIGSSIFGARS
jgi:pyridoxal phosphate enzyme (YggS family)